MEVVPLGGGHPDPHEPAPGPCREARPRWSRTHRPPECPLVLVTWQDAWFDFDEPDPQDVRADYLVRTVGYLVRRGPRFVSVAQEILPDGDGFRAVTHIPSPSWRRSPRSAVRRTSRTNRPAGSVERVYSPSSARSTRRHVHKKEGCEMTAHTVTVSAQRPSVSR